MRELCRVDQSPRVCTSEGELAGSRSASSLDSGKEISTGASEQDIRAAEAALEEYLGAKRHPNFGRGHPASVLIDDVLSEYGNKHGPITRRADLIGVAMDHLLGFFSGRMCASVTSAACSDYVRWRTAQTDARAKRNGRPVKASTARRELVVLSAIKSRRNVG